MFNLIARLINEDQENRIAKLKLNDTSTEDEMKAKASEVELECVSTCVSEIKSHNCYI